MIWFLINENNIKADQQKLSDRQERNILRKAKVLQEVRNFSVKRVMVRAGIPPSISTVTVRRIMRKVGLK